MPANTGQFSKLLAPGLRTVFLEDYKQFPAEYSRYFNEVTSTKNYEEEATFMGLGRLERKIEGVSLTVDNGKQGNTKRYTHLTYGLKFEVTEEMWEDDQYGVMKRMAKMLSRSVQQTIELEAGLFLDDMFTGARYTGADGQPLMSNGHVLLIGGTFDNNGGAVDLSPGSLRTAHESCSSLVDERGLPIFKVPKLLVVTPANAWIANDIIKATQVPYSANNEPNSTQDIMQLRYAVTHYQADSDQWSVFPEKSEHDLKWFWRVKPKFRNWDDPDTGNAMFGVRTRFCLGFTDWRGAYGGTG